MKYTIEDIVSLLNMHPCLIRIRGEKMIDGNYRRDIVLQEICLDEKERKAIMENIIRKQYITIGRFRAKAYITNNPATYPINNSLQEIIFDTNEIEEVI